MEKPRIWKVYEQEKVISVIHRFLPLTLLHVNYVPIMTPFWSTKTVDGMLLTP